MIDVAHRHAHAGREPAAHYLRYHVCHTASSIEKTGQVVMLRNDFKLAVVLRELGLGRELVSGKDTEDDYQREEYRYDIDYLESNRHRL